MDGECPISRVVGTLQRGIQCNSWGEGLFVLGFRLDKVIADHLTLTLPSTLQVTESHPLHIDVDEACFRDPGVPLRSPLASTVIFLSQEGGHTLVTDQTIEKTGERGWCVKPIANGALTFRGGLLHGVIPAHDVESGDGSRRITLVMTWWGADRCVREGQPGVGVAQRPPTDREHASTGLKWPVEASCLLPEMLVATPGEKDDGGHANTSPQEESPPESIEPLWCQVSTGAASEGAPVPLDLPGAGAPRQWVREAAGPALRRLFFLVDSADVARTYADAVPYR